MLSRSLYTDNLRVLTAMVDMLTTCIAMPEGSYVQIRCVDT